MSLDYNKKLIPLAKTLRKNATKQENRLWYDCLSSSPVRFQRQKVIGDYIVDFYCDEAKLVIEIDGTQHETLVGLQNDFARTNELETYGLLVVRFTNNEIDNNFSYVCNSIDEVLNNRLEL